MYMYLNWSAFALVIAAFVLNVESVLTDDMEKHLIASSDGNTILVQLSPFCCFFSCARLRPFWYPLFQSGFNFCTNIDMASVYVRIFI